MIGTVDQAMVLAAGLGTRMRPITETIPKPLVQVAGKAMLDYALDALVAAGVARSAVNVHYLADQIEDHLANRTDPEVAISNERERLLDSGGGVKHALPHLTGDSLIILNADSFWIDGKRNNLRAMQQAWDPDMMDMLLLVSTKDTAVGFDGPGDFFADAQGRLARRNQEPAAPLIYAGAIIARMDLFHNVDEAKFSLNQLFDNAIATGRLYSTVLDGLWLHVGTPASIHEAEAAIAAHNVS